MSLYYAYYASFAALQVALNCLNIYTTGLNIVHSLIITREGFFIVNLIKTQWKPTISNENQQVSMNERFAFDDICICVFGYFVSAYFCIFVQNSYLYFICVCHNHHHLFCSSTLLFMRAKEREIRSFRIHYDDGNIFLFISVADWSFWRF